MTTLASDLDALKIYRWKSRVLVLKSANAKNILEAKQKLAAFKDELTDRQVVILEDPTGSVFEIKLYGKDGEKKWQSSQNFEVQKILDLIDSMPMRQQEQK